MSNDTATEEPPHGFALWTIAVLAWITCLALVITFTAMDEFQSARVGVGAWADIFLHVGIASTVGAIVLGGVRASLRHRLPAQEQYDRAQSEATQEP
ncbi:hypothetical protein B5M43_001660 [Microbacterium sp. MEC084]|uniref:hypothetical protein n=1 Tax=Microbacterium sp. MEC084 TaxID=1963027 RepID=UPI0010705157|nr:hypothetical protein [Microbacterium sp. MEC084]MCD1267559.1 hypothetical protein [Microbacterium sp. MEC084]